MSIPYDWSKLDVKIGEAQSAEQSVRKAVTAASLRGKGLIRLAATAASFDNAADGCRNIRRVLKREARARRLRLAKQLMRYVALIIKLMIAYGGLAVSLAKEKLKLLVRLIYRRGE
jgi:hypothetical protein